LKLKRGSLILERSSSMKRFACYLNPWYDLKVMTVYGTLPDMVHYKRARAGLALVLAIVSFLVTLALRIAR
jgi:hypothetical protein